MTAENKLKAIAAQDKARAKRITETGNRRTMNRGRGFLAEAARIEAAAAEIAA